MEWIKVFQKGGLGFATFLGAYLASNPNIITNLVPENIAQMTIGGLVSAVVVGFANWLKNRDK